MNYTPTIYDRIDDVPMRDWSQVACEPADLAMEPRLLGAFESTMASQCRCWYVIVRDAQNVPVAAACLCLFRIDALETTGPTARAMTRLIRRAFPGYMHFRVLFCGLPTPSADSHLRIAPGADRAAALQSLDTAMRSLARQHRARLLVLKEFPHACRDNLKPLEAMGYLVGDVPSARRLDQRFETFDAYLAAMRARYRKQVVESLDKFSDTACQMEHVTGEQVAGAMTEEVYRLYLNVRDRAKYRMETFPIEFFHEISRRFGDDAAMTVIRRDARVIGFAFSLTFGRECHNLYVGLDYARNLEADVYFNLHYLDLDRAFRRGCTRIHFGQTGDEFKSRLGCSADPLLFYVRAANPLIHGFLRKFSRWVFPPIKPPTLLNVFRNANAPKVSASLEPVASSARQAPDAESTLPPRR